MKKIILSLLAAYLCLSCSNSRTEQESAKRTVLVYMAADNNLIRQARKNIEAMLTAKIPNEYNLLVYIDSPTDNPYLLKIAKGKIDTIKQYNTQNSASKNVLKSVINDAFSLFPAENYGLILWSHSTGWLPEGVYDYIKETNTRSFGKDKNKEMEITDLAEALPENLDFIIFDACLMSGIEVLYQLRNKAKIIIASPTETLVAGFPYEKTIPILLTPSPNYGELALVFMEHYKNNDGDLQSASIAVIDAKQLEPLANLVKRAIKNEVCPNRELIQRYDTREPALLFDFEDYLERIISNESDLIALRKQISRAVIYNDFTPYFLDEFPIEKSCGIGIYIPFANDVLYEPYSSLDWYKDSGLFCI
ncbi:MAG: hypothetical protein LBC87_07595 [Fibromonadaceae bacterium]|nr:hypothetical protein [Fibromonadaceae bacterium]